MNVWNLGIFGRITDYQEQERALVRWTVQNFIQEFHRAGGVSQAGQSGMVQGIDQHTGGDANRFLYVVQFFFAAIRQDFD